MLNVEVILLDIVIDSLEIVGIVTAPLRRVVEDSAFSVFSLVFVHCCNDDLLTIKSVIFYCVLKHSASQHICLRTCTKYCESDNDFQIGKTKRTIRATKKALRLVPIYQSLIFTVYKSGIYSLDKMGGGEPW